MEKDKYPSWKDALFGDHEDAVANLRCAVKYVIWHGAYLVLALVGVLLVSGATVLRSIGQTAESNKVSSAIHSRKAKKASRMLWIAFLLLGLVYCVAILIYVAITDTITFLKIMVAVVLATVFGVAVIVGGENHGTKVKSYLRKVGKPVKRSARTAGSKAAKTPVIRRIYGYCPVSMNISPRWFEKLFGKE